MDLARFNEMLISSVAVGLAVVEPQSRELLYCNRRFGEWFPVTQEGTVAIDEVLPTLNYERMAERLEKGRIYKEEAEVRVGKRPMKLAVSVEKHDRDGHKVLIMECHNITKIKELEFMIESYSTMIEKRNRELEREKERVEKLLLNIMPKTVYEEWKAYGVTTPQRYDASVLMLDFVDFSEMAVTQDPASLIGELNDIFTAIDRIVEQFGGERIKTIGDAYVAVCGIPEPSADHAQNIANIALRIVRYLKHRNAGHEEQWRCRIGLASGPVVGSIVGIQKYVYDVFGPVVNLAARMEALAGPMEICLTEEMCKLIEERFVVTPKGTQEVKGFGEKEIFRLIGGGDMSVSAIAL